MVADLLQPIVHHRFKNAGFGGLENHVLGGEQVDGPGGCNGILTHLNFRLAACLFSAVRSEPLFCTCPYPEVVRPRPQGRSGASFRRDDLAFRTMGDPFPGSASPLRLARL
jgi:hypothetical protein